MTAEAPSLVCDEFPAVTVPSARNAGRSFASASADVSRRGPSSTAKVKCRVVGPVRLKPDTTPFDAPVVVSGFSRTLSSRPSSINIAVTGTISSTNRPASIAAIAR